MAKGADRVYRTGPEAPGRAAEARPEPAPPLDWKNLTNRDVTVGTRHLDGMPRDWRAWDVRVRGVTVGTHEEQRVADAHRNALEHVILNPATQVSGTERVPQVINVPFPGGSDKAPFKSD